MMATMRLTRRLVPDDVRDRLRLGPHERVLAVGRDDTGRSVVGTSHRLFLPTGDEDFQSLAWEQIDRASWDEETAELRIVESAPFGESMPSYVVQLAEPGRLVEHLRERVTASIVISRRVVVAGRRGVTAVGRRPPVPSRPGAAADDGIVWSYSLDAGLRTDDPAVLDAAAHALATARDDVGL